MTGSSSLRVGLFASTLHGKSFTYFVEALMQRFSLTNVLVLGSTLLPRGICSQRAMTRPMGFSNKLVPSNKAILRPLLRHLELN